MRFERIIDIAFSCLLFLLLFFPCGGIVRAADREAFPEIEPKFPSASKSIKIGNAVIDYGGRLKLVLEEGKLYGRRDGRVFDYFFDGRGYVDIIDTAGISGRHDSHYRFESGYFCAENLPGLLGLDEAAWDEDKIDRRNWKKLQFMLKTPDKYFGVDLSGELALWSKHESRPLPVWVNLEIGANKHLVIFLTPDIPEQLSVYLLDKMYDTPYIVTGFSLGDMLTTRPVKIDSSHISIHLKEMGRFEAACTLHFPSETDRRGLKLVLPHLYKVDSVLDASGAQLPFRKRDRRAGLYIVLGDSNSARMADSSVPKITVCYNGQFLQSKIMGVDAPVNMTTWFPQLPHRNLGGFTIDYTFHKDLDLISVGRQIGEKMEGDLKTVTYKTEDNLSYISFASGVYDRFADTVCGRRLSLYVRKRNTQGLFNRDVPQKVLSDIRRSYGAYCDWFGPPQAQSLDIVDQPMMVFQSSPGLIHLSEISFYARRDQAHFRAHEVAHQWWGHTAVPASYRDMWLSEGLAEISAALYLLKVKEDSVEFNRLKDTWRQHVVEEGKINGVYSRGYEAGSILQGARLLQSYSPADYVSLVYSKAAYMLLMLRFELDGPEYRTDFFIGMLAEYGRRFHGQKATSLDFMKIAQKHMGQKRAYEFFRQWLYDWKIPRFTCRYGITRDDKERPIVMIEIDAEGVDEGFETPFPIEIEFADGSKQNFRLDGAGAGLEYQLGPFPREIKKVRFNPHRTILSLGEEVIAQ